MPVLTERRHNRPCNNANRDNNHAPHLNGAIRDDVPVDEDANADGADQYVDKAAYAGVPHRREPFRRRSINHRSENRSVGIWNHLTMPRTPAVETIFMLRG